MDSWFGKIREKLVIERTTEDDVDSDEERRRKEEQMKDTLRKLNTDEMLSDDEIARASVLSVRKPIKDDTIPTKEVPKGSPSNVLEKGSFQISKEPEVVPEKTPASSLDTDEPYGSQFWD